MKNEELLQRAQFGHQIELFWSSRIGEYLRDRISEVYSAGIEELKKVDSENAKEIRRIQNDIFKVQSIEQWLSEAVSDGLKSLEILEGQDDEE